MQQLEAFIRKEQSNFIAKSTTKEGEQSIPKSIFEDTDLTVIDLSGNQMISKSIVMGFEGVSDFIERRKKSLDKNLAGGPLSIEVYLVIWNDSGDDLKDGE